MNVKIRKIAVMILLFFWAPAIACGVCPREVRGLEKSDLLDWDRSSLVFVAKVVSSNEVPARPEDVFRTFRHDYEIEELLKGNAASRPRLFTQGTLERPNGITEILVCGHVYINPGDRVLVFVENESEVLLRVCGSSRVMSPHDKESEETLNRLRAWQE